MPSLVARVSAAFDAIFHEMAKFGAVGAANVVIDAGIYNGLRLTKLGDKPLTAAVISTTVAIVSSYLMNRHWTWRHTQRAHPVRELVLFFAISGVGLLVALGCLWASHYGLGHRSLLADNVAKNGFGLVLGMAWRFWAFKRWIFLAVEGDQPANTDSADLTVRTTV